MVRCVEYFAELISEVGEMLKRRTEGATDGLGNARAARVNGVEILKNASLERAVPCLLEWTDGRRGIIVSRRSVALSERERDEAGMREWIESLGYGESFQT